MESLYLHAQGNWQTLSRMTINRLRVLTLSRVGTHFISEKVAYLKWNAYLCMVAIQDRLFKRKWGVGVLTHSRVGTPFFRQMLVRSLGNDYLCITMPLRSLALHGEPNPKGQGSLFHWWTWLKFRKHRYLWESYIAGLVSWTWDILGTTWDTVSFDIPFWTQVSAYLLSPISFPHQRTCRTPPSCVG